MSASGQKQLEVILNYRDQLSGRAGRTIKSLSGIEKGANAAAKSVDKLNKILARNVPARGLDAYERRLGKLRGELRTSMRDAETMRSSFGRDLDTRGIDAAIAKVRELQKANKALARSGDSGAPSRPPRPGDWMKDSDRPPDWRRQLRDQERRAKGRDEHKPHGLLERAEQFNEVVETTGQVVNAWRERAESLEKYTDAYLELAQARNKFRAGGLPEMENLKAFEAVDRTVKNIRGLTLAGTTETLTDLTVALGNLDHALEALPIASRYRFGIQTLMGDQFSEQQVESQIQSGFKFLEMINAVRATGEADAHGKRAFTEDDQQRLETYFNRVTQMTAVTGGRVTPAEMLAMAKTGGMAMQGLTPEGLAHLTGPLTELGGSRTGTAVQSVYQATVGGVMPAHMIPNWQRLGLIDNSKVELNKSGIPKRIEPGAVTIGSLFQKDPLEFFDALREAMQSHGIDTSNVNTVNTALTGLFGRSTSRELSSLFVNQRDRIVKESNNTLGAKDVGGLYTQGLNSDMGKLREFESQWTNFKAQMGKPLVEGLTGLTQALTPILQFFASHPDVTRYGAEVLVAWKAVTALAETGTLLKSSGILGWFSSATTAAGETAEGIGEATAKAGGLRGTLGSLPKGIQIGLTIAAIGFTFTELMELKRWADEKKAAEKTLDSASADRSKSYGDMVQSFRNLGEAVPQKLVEGQAATLLSVLNKDHEFEYAFDPSRESWYHRFYMQGTNPFRTVPDDIARQVLQGARTPGSDIRKRVETDKDYSWFFGDGKAIKNIMAEETGARFFRQRAGELGNADVMSAFLKQIESLKLPDEGKSRLMKELELAFPESFKQATQQTADAISKLNEPATRLGTGLNAAQDAASRFAARVNSLDIKSPTIAPRGFTFGPPLPGATDGGLSHKGFFFSAPTRATGGVVRRGGFVEVHDEEAIVPADVTSRWRDGEFAGAPDYSAFRAGGAPQITVQIGDINVGAGDDARETGASVAREVERQVREVLARLARVEGDLYDPRRIDGMVASARERVAQRS